MILWEMRGSLQALVVIVLTIVSWRRGAAPERATAAVLMAMVVVALLYRYLSMPLMPGRIFAGYAQTDPAQVLIDGAALVALVVIALRANRIYPIWMAGFQLTATAMHFVNAIAFGPAQLAYALLNVLPFYFMIAAQAFGLWQHIRMMKRRGPYPNWRNGSGPSRETRQT